MDSYPLPCIDFVLDAMVGATLFPALVRPSVWLLAVRVYVFSVGSGPYEYNVLPFGVCNGPATFQRLMDVVHDGLN